MKLRIKDNSIRLRLSKIDVADLAREKKISAQLILGETKFIYELHVKENTSSLTASLQNNLLAVYISSAYVKDWEANTVVGFKAVQEFESSQPVSILIEKDFQCLDDTDEDQSDNYTNPNSVC